LTGQVAMSTIAASHARFTSPKLSQPAQHSPAVLDGVRLWRPERKLVLPRP